MSATPKHLIPIVATVFVMLFLWISAVPLLSWYELSGQHQELQDAMFIWQRHELENYNFEIEVSENDQPLDPIRIHVRDTKFLAAYGVDDNEAVDIADLADVPITIDESYEFVAQLLEARPYRITVEYDATWAYPKRIQFADSDDSNDAVIVSIRRLEIVPDAPQ